MALYRATKIPSDGVDAEDVAVATSLQLRRAGAATGQAAGMVGAVRTVTAAGYISSTDTVVRGDTTAAGFTLTLPRISEYAKMIVYVMRSAGANTLTVASRGTDTIDGAASIAVTSLKIIFPVSNSAWVSVTIG